MAERKKISELEFRRSFDGDENIGLAVDGGNMRTDLNTLKEFFGDSGSLVFTDIVDSDVNVLPDALTPEEGAVIDVVYLSKRKQFVARKTITDTSVSYSSSFASRGEYMSGNTPRMDRAYICVADKGIYMWNGAMLGNILDTVRINAMTEEEFNNLQNPIEGAFYATFEE